MYYMCESHSWNNGGCDAAQGMSPMMPPHHLQHEQAESYCNAEWGHPGRAERGQKNGYRVLYLPYGPINMEASGSVK